MASTVVSALFGSYDLRNAKQWRDEDVAFRDEQTQWLNDDTLRAHQWRLADLERALRREKLDAELSLCSARAEQLSAVSEQCTLFCGFTVAAMCNVGLTADSNAPLVTVYVVAATAVCVSLLLCALMCVHLLIAVTRYAAYALEARLNELDLQQLETSAPFGDWWLKKCERQQLVAHRFMLAGVALFFVFLGTVVWFQFGLTDAAPASMSAIALVGFGIWQLRIASKWRYLLAPPTSATNTSRSSFSSSIASSRASLAAFNVLATPKTPLSASSTAIAQRKAAVTLS